MKSYFLELNFSTFNLRANVVFNRLKNFDKRRVISNNICKIRELCYLNSYQSSVINEPIEKEIGESGILRFCHPTNIFFSSFIRLSKNDFSFSLSALPLCPDDDEFDDSLAIRWSFLSELSRRVLRCFATSSLGSVSATAPCFSRIFTME